MPRRAFGQAASGAGIILMGTWHHEQDSRPGQSEMDYNHVIHQAADIIRTVAAEPTLTSVGVLAIIVLIPVLFRAEQPADAVGQPRRSSGIEGADA
jgi:hypothetical protein